MNLREPKVQRIILVIVFVVTVTYLYFGTSMLSICYNVKKDKIESLEIEYTKLSTELEKARKMVGNLARLEAEYERLHDQWLSAQQLLPEEKEMPDLLRKVTTAGNKAGVQFMMFQPHLPVEQEFLTEHPIFVKVKGGYHSLGIFLSRVANMPRIVNVNGLTISTSKLKKKDDKVDSNETITAEFTLTAYTLLGGYEHEISE
jgi:type IV pilus assembly protein PilO